jgi:DNA primase
MNKEQAQIFLKNSFGGLSEISEIHHHAEPYEKLVEVFWANGLTNREYWYKRCLKDDTIDRYKLGYFNEWNMVPFYENGDFVNFQMRREIPEKRIHQYYKHGKPILFNEGILPFTKTVYITEGTVDAILLNQEGFPAVSPNGTNTWQDEWFSKFSHIESITYLADNDKAGQYGARLVAKCLGLGRVKIVNFSGKDEKYDSVNFFQDGGNKETFRDYVKDNSHFLFELEGINDRSLQQKSKRTKSHLLSRTQR